MPSAYSNPGSDDPYSDAAPSETAPEKDKAPDEQGEEKTATLPKSICPDMKPGDEMVLKIVAVHEDEYEVAYAPEKDHKEEESEPMGKPEGDDQMASMME